MENKKGKKSAWDMIREILEGEVFYIKEISRHPESHSFSISMMMGNRDRFKILILPSDRQGKEVKIQVRAGEANSSEWDFERNAHI